MARRALLCGAALLLLLSAAIDATAATLSAEQIANPLAVIVDGQDKAFGTAVAPAQSLDTARAPKTRSRAVIDRIAHEVSTVTTAFATATRENRIGATKTAVARFNPETARDGASRSFEGSAPSLSVMRQLLFVPKASAAISAAAVMDAVSQFERSPKTDDIYYEYSNPADLKGSSIADLRGSAASWTTAARPPMAPGQVYALKKCRHIVILGWYCNTSLYQRRALGNADGGVPSLITLLRPLPKGADNPHFDGERAKNIVDGYTALYVAVDAGDLVLVYNLGIQSKAGAASQQGRLNEGHKAEYRQLVSFLETKLATGKLPF
jgi:hypothetical protein